MRQLKKYFLRAFILLSFVGLGFSEIEDPSSSPDKAVKEKTRNFVVIVNRINPIDEIKKSDLVDIYKGRKRKWDKGGQIYVINQTQDSSLRVEFYWEILRAAVDQQFYRENESVFRTVELGSSSAIINFVASMPYAIGYIEQGEMNGKIKALKIQ